MCFTPQNFDKFHVGQIICPDFQDKPCLAKMQKSGFFGVRILSKPLYIEINIDFHVIFLKIICKQVNMLHIIRNILQVAVNHQTKSDLNEPYIRIQSLDCQELVSLLIFQFIVQTMNDQHIQLKILNYMIRYNPVVVISRIILQA